MTPLALLVIVIAVALAFDFLNGFHDSANVVATVVTTRAMSPRVALAMAAAANLVGPFVFGVAVAKTVGSEVVVPAAVTIAVVVAALLSASLWNLGTWYFGLPSSSSHALVGGIVGAAAAESGLSAIESSGLWKIGIALLVSPFLGFAICFLVTRSTLWLARGATPSANEFFKRAQIPSAIALALSHGGNDAQKTMGVITLALVVLGFQAKFAVPVWVVFSSALAIAAGTALGGWRLIRTLGGKFYRVRPIHGFTSQLSSAAVIVTASVLGGPVSTTQVVSFAILAAGAAERKSKVRWGVLTDIVVAWVLTVPTAAATAALLYFAVRSVVG